MKKFLATILALISLILCGTTAMAESASSATDILEELGASNMSETTNNPAGDTLISNPASRIDFNNTSYAFLDEDGNIVRINRLDEIDSLYMQNPTQPSYNSAFLSTDALIEFIEDKIIGSEYVLTDESNFDATTLSLRYERKLPNGALDNFDTYSIYIDETYVELASLFKTSSNYICPRNALTITSSDALAIARSILNMEDTSQSYNVELATAKTNTFFDGSLAEGIVRLAYIVETDSHTVYVDAYTGDVLGGDIFKTVKGGAVGTPVLSTTTSSLGLAQMKLHAMGYYTTTTSVTKKFATAIPNLLNSAFYCTGHGMADCLVGTDSLTDEDSVFYASSVPSGDYKFVFLDACNTASAQWKNAFGISNTSTNKAFLGWAQTVKADAALEFCEFFWNEISSTTSVRQAAINAASAQGDGLAIEFTGDRNYNGFY